MKAKIHLIAFLAIVLSFSIATAQTAPGKQWDARFGGNGDDQLSSLQQTADGGYILGGNSLSGASGDKTQPGRGFEDYWIVRTDAAGVKQWDARFGGSNNDYFRSLQQTADGGYILGGVSYSGASGDKTQASQGLGDYWIVKTDSAGVKQWDVRFGGSDYEDLGSLQQTADGGYILGGSSSSGISGDKTQASQGGYDYWIVKTDAAGVKQWDARFGGSDYDYLGSLQQTADGGYILGGSSASGISGDKTQASQGGYDYWIVKTDASGVKQWDARFGGSGGDYLGSIQQTADGGYILGGSSTSGFSGDKTQASRGLEDYWIVKTDASGIKQWDARFGGSADEYFHSLQQTADGGYILGGTSFSGISGDKTQASRGNVDYWIVKTDTSGIKQWDARFGGSGGDYLGFIQQTADEGYILGGESYSGASGDITQPSQSPDYSDYWILKLYPEILPCSAPPTGLYADFISSTKAKLHWDADPGAIKYRVKYRKITDPAWTTILANSNFKKLSSLEPSTEYQYRVRSLCAPDSLSGWSDIATFTTNPLRQGEFPSNQPSFTIYPNPNAGSFYLQMEGIENEVIQIRITNLLGEEVYAETINSEDEINHNIAINQLIENGMYLMEVKTSGKIYKAQIIISQ